jgi:hypothetical protein
MDKSLPDAGTTRPAWACLDGEEMRTTAMGQPVDRGIREHLSRCAECRRAVKDLRRELGHAGGHSELRGASMLARPKFWLVLLALALLAFAGVVVIGRRSEKPTPSPVVTSEPVVAPAASPPVRRARPRPRRSAGPSIDAEIVATIRRNQAGVRICYERALKRNDGLTLRLDVQVGVRPTGVVEQVSFDGPAGAPGLTSCIRNVIKTWQFPRAPEAYQSSFPLRLQPSP